MNAFLRTVGGLTVLAGVAAGIVVLLAHAAREPARAAPAVAEDP